MASRMASKSEIIAKRFAKKYIANDMNGKKTYRELHPTASEATATVNASKTLMKTNVKTEIAKILDDKGLTMDLITKIHKRNLEQDKQLSVSQSAVEVGYRLRGYLTNKDDNKQTNIAIVVNK